MENNNIFELLNTKKTKRIIIGTVIAIAIIIGGYKVINTYLINKNTSNFTNYLIKNNFEKNADKTYTKKIVNKKENLNEYEYIYTQSNSSVSKNINKVLKNGQQYISLTYHKNNTIKGTLQLHGLNKNNTYGTLLLNGKYNTKNNTFTCKILNNDNFYVQCDSLKKEMLKFNKELKKWTNEGKFKLKYIK